MDIKKAFGTNKEQAENGKWFNLDDDCRVLVAKLGNRKFKAEVTRLQKPHMMLLRSKKFDSSDLIDKITTEAMSKTLLLGWEGIELDGAPLEYTQENSLMLLKELPDFKEVISDLAVDSDNFSLEAEEIDSIAGK